MELHLIILFNSATILTSLFLGVFIGYHIDKDKTTKSIDKAKATKTKIINTISNKKLSSSIKLKRNAN